MAPELPVLLCCVSASVVCLGCTAYLRTASHLLRMFGAGGECGQQCTSRSVSVISPAETMWQCDSAWAVTVWAHDSCHAQEVAAAR